MKDPNAGLLDDLAPKRKVRIVKKKFHSNKGVSAETAARRMAAMEASAENPLPWEQKEAILMKYGVKPAVIERDIRMPAWRAATIRQLSEREVSVVWNHRMQDWYKETKGLTALQKTRGSVRGYMRSKATQRSTSTTGSLQRDARPWNRPLPEKFRIGSKEFNQNLQRQHQNNRRSSVRTDKSTRSPQN
jgi:hypothetical protein